LSPFTWGKTNVTFLKALDGPATHSMPTRYSGNGKINIILNQVTTKGYSLLFISNTTLSLFDQNGTLIVSSSLSNNEWILNSNNINLTVENNQSSPYKEMDLLYFSVLNSPTLYSNINIE